MAVWVLDKTKQPLMPCSEKTHTVTAVARPASGTDRQESGCLSGSCDREGLRKFQFPDTTGCRARHQSSTLHANPAGGWLWLSCSTEDSTNPKGGSETGRLTARSFALKR